MPTYTTRRSSTAQSLYTESAVTHPGLRLVLRILTRATPHGVPGRWDRWLEGSHLLIKHLIQMRVNQGRCARSGIVPAVRAVALKARQHCPIVD
eukprot:scaffold51240_cov63-Phaeocystis_antarctica.AAC.4